MITEGSTPATPKITSRKAPANNRAMAPLARLPRANTIANTPKVFDEEDLKLAVELADFAAIALENASLFGELQRTAITDSLTGLYNTRFFNEVLSREAARADRYSTPLSLLMPPPCCAEFSQMVVLSTSTIALP